MSVLYISGGQILDLDGDVDHPPIQDLLIEDGKITALGTEATRQALHRNETRRFDASGKLLIPGLVNSHYHSHDVFLRGRFEQMPLDIWSLYSSPTNYSHAAPADIYLRTLLGAADCLVNGVTTMQDMVAIGNADPMHLDAIVDAYQSSGVRTSLGLQIFDKPAIDTVPYWNELEPTLRERFSSTPSSVTELRDLVEASARSISRDRLSWALAPSAPQRCSVALWNWVSRLWSETGMQIFTHMYEARSQAVHARKNYEGGSYINFLQEFGLLGPHLTISHGVWIDDEELAKFGGANANMVFNPVSNLKLLNGFAPIRDYVTNGANVALGCDNCSGNDAQSLFQSMKLFALYWAMQSTAGESGAARQAFSAATIGGAKALGLQDKVGQIRTGFNADIVVLDLSSSTYRPLNSALNQVVYGETGQSIDSVIVAGEIVVRRGELLHHPSRLLKEAAEDARERLNPEWEIVAERNKTMSAQLLDAFGKAQEYPLKIDRHRLQPNCNCC